MSESPADVFVVTLEAVEPGAAGPLTVLAFVRAADETAAERDAAVELARCGFVSSQALRTAHVIDAAALPEDFRSAMATALRYGCGLIIYDEP